MKRDTESKVTVEDLIRLKRAERPPAEFWTRFESEMRSKQLSAIVYRRPWWHGISSAVVFVSRHQLPFGAAAALALTWAGVHYNFSPSKGLRTGGEMAPRAVSVASVAPARIQQVVEHVVAAPSAVVAGAKESPQALPPVVNAGASHLTKAPSELSLDAVSKSPFADGIAVTLADYREASPEFARKSVFGSDSEFEQVSPSSRQTPAEPLARMDPASERRARLLAPALPAYTSGSPRTVASDWIRSRSSANDRIYESMDRESNDRMLVGFRF